MLRRVKSYIPKISRRRVATTPPDATPPSGATATAALSSDASPPTETILAAPMLPGAEGQDAFGVDGTGPPNAEQPPVDTLPLGLKVLVDQPQGAANIVDIIAIHGLGGQYLETWTDEESGINWLADKGFLSKDIPQARILSFGYNSAVYFTRSEANIADFASELLAAISSKRRTAMEKQRPIIFVCHSLGGIVFKRAIIRAHERDNHYKQIIESSKGVVFFATPHRGSDLATWSHLADLFVKAATFGYSGNTRLPKDLKLNSEALMAISNAFSSRGSAFVIRSFYEIEKMPRLNCRVVEKYSAIMDVSNEIDISSSSNHSNICKFASRADQRYENAVAAILDGIPAAEAATQPQSIDGKLSNRENLLLQRLEQNYKDKVDQLDQVDDPVGETCKWVLSHPKWQQWQSYLGSSLLWITSNAGCGKSVLAKFLVQHFISRQKTHPASSLCYFFFVEGIAKQDNATVAMSALLHQLYDSRHELIKHALDRLGHEKLDNAINKMSVLWEILVKSIHASPKLDVIWVLDGVEECEVDSLKTFITKISRLLDSWSSSEQAPAESRLKIILISRPNNIIQNTLELFDDTEASSSRKKLRLFGENETEAITNDIKQFAECEIKKLPDWPKKYLQEHIKTLVHDADYTFLWISMIIKLVKSSTLDSSSIKELKKILTTTRLDDVYRALLAHNAGADPTKTRKVLSIILAASRPLTLDELCVAVEIDMEDCAATRGVSSWSSSPKTLGEVYEVLKKPFDNYIRAYCGHFVRVRCGQVYLVHQTARQFLMGDRFTLQRKTQTWRPYIWQPIALSRATRQLLNICVNYLQMFTQDSKNDEIVIWYQSDVDRHLESCKKDPPRAFFPYAAFHWVRHYRRLRKELKYQYDWMLEPDTVHFRAWAKVHWSWTEEHLVFRDNPGGIAIKGAKQEPENAELETLRKLYADFQLLQWSLSSQPKVDADSADPYKNAQILTKRLSKNERYRALTEYFARESIAEALRGGPQTRQGGTQPQWNLGTVEGFIETVIREWGEEVARYCSRHTIWPSEGQLWIRNTAYESARRGSKRSAMANFDALVHFHLLELEEIGADLDEELQALWPRPDEAAAGDGQAMESSWSDMSHHTKRLARDTAMKMLDEDIGRNGTPGATLPSLSNPGAQRAPLPPWSRSGGGSSWNRQFQG